MQNYGFETLTIIDRLCKKDDIVYWLYGGTLLGMVRDRGFIDSDTDIDIAIWDTKANHTKLEELLPSVGFAKLYEFSWNENVFVQRFERKGVGVDIKYLRKNNSYSYATGFKSDGKGIYVVEDRYKSDTFDKTTHIKIDSIALSVPNNYIYILETSYGNWQTPITKKDGYIHFKNSNQIHLQDIRAKRVYYAASIIKVSLGERIKHLMGLSVIDR